MGLMSLSYAIATSAPLLEPAPGKHAEASLKPRMVVLSDIAALDVEPDDTQSLIHLFASADVFQIDGIIATTGWSQNETTPLQTHYIDNAIDAYEIDVPNMMKRSGQTGFLPDETIQAVGYWPSPNYLRSVVRVGQPIRGMGGVGDDRCTNGSQHIIDVVDMDDMRPVWVDFWGSGNTLAQAIWDVRRTRTAAQLDEFLAKIRVYAVTDQDRGNDGEGYANSAQFWMRKTFKLFYIWAESAWLTYAYEIKFMYWSTYQSLIQGRGALGSLYPTYKYAVEGDSPSWLHLWPGLNDPNSPSQAGFGGRFIYGTGPDNQTQAFVDNLGVAANQSSAAINNTLVDQINDFVARIDWATNGTGNRNPKLAVAGNNGYETLVVEVAPSETVILSAVGSSDPDGNTIKYSWTQDSGVGYTNMVPVEGSASEVAAVQVPAAAAGKDIHIVLRGVDDGSPPLASYRRIILRVTLK
ncbi:hypothetical protein IWW34DRAFT_811110 [Fusarium oxysporum f. sp. albedinis]|nr:hypothetical protein IWW34DRAFT_811110 [Fusarium oxysporum f. sp. albedinis]